MFWVLVSLMGDFMSTSKVVGNFKLVLILSLHSISLVSARSAVQQLWSIL